MIGAVSSGFIVTARGTGARALAAALRLAGGAVVALGMVWPGVVGNGAAAAQAMPGEAGQFVRALGNEVISVLSDHNLDVGKRREVLRGIFMRSFDSKTIARFALGRYWRTANQRQKDRYLAVFPFYVADVYASQLAGYSGETFVVLRSRRVSDSKIVVNAEIQRPDGSALKVDFRVRRTTHGYKNIDVLVERLSLLVTKRDEFSTVVRRKGMDGLLSLLERQTEGLRSSASAG